MYNCFVICPFGKEHGNREERRVYQERMNLRRNIFPRVVDILARDGLSVSIGDSQADRPHDEDLSATIRRVGQGSAGAYLDKIREDTTRRIEEADVVIVVATNSEKPNTWIELGWADGVWQVPILLVRDKFSLPTDVNNTISVYFTSFEVSGAEPAACEALAQRLASRVKERLAGPRRVNRFAHRKASVAATGRSVLYDRFHDFGFAEWSAIIQDAKDEIIIASPRMLDMLDRENAFFWQDRSGRRREVAFNDLLQAKAIEDGVRVTVLMQHPDNYDLPYMVGSSAAIGELKASLERSYERWAQTTTSVRDTARRGSPHFGGEGQPSVEDAFRVIQIRSRFLPYRVTLTEKRALVTLRFHTERVNSGPCIDCSPAGHDYELYNRPLYEQVRDELKLFISENQQASEEALETYRRRRG